MTDRPTLEDRMRGQDRAKHARERKEAAKGHPNKVACPSCGRPAWPFEIVEIVPDDGIDDDLACTQCVEGKRRELQAEREAAERKAAPAWDQPHGIELKAERDRRVNAALWAAGPGSPLDETAQLEWSAYIGRLHLMTVDHTPENWIWPERPALRYKSVSQQKGAIHDASIGRPKTA